MRLDHIAYRVSDRKATARFFTECFEYSRATGKDLTNGEFDLKFPDGSRTKCIVLIPPEKEHRLSYYVIQDDMHAMEWHMAPEIFISDGSENSIVGKWVAERNGVGGIHHIAYQVHDVEKTMKEWQEKGFAEFASEKPLVCPGLVQVFTKPSKLTGIVFELIKRDVNGFCVENVMDLMRSSI